jgi:hypothetical protein
VLKREDVKLPDETVVGCFENASAFTPEFLPHASNFARNACDGSWPCRSCLEFVGIGGIIGAESG